jgi:hypothetical protein
MQNASHEHKIIGRMTGEHSELTTARVLQKVFTKRNRLNEALELSFS